MIFRGEYTDKRRIHGLQAVPFSLFTGMSLLPGSLIDGVAAFVSARGLYAATMVGPATL